MVIEEGALTFQKKERIVDNELLETCRNLPCLAHNCPPRNHPHHIKTRGAGGDDIATNILPLCNNAHREIHAIGLTAFAEKYRAVYYWLKLASWEFDEGRNKWIPPFEGKPER